MPVTGCCGWDGRAPDACPTTLSAIFTDLQRSKRLGCVKTFPAPMRLLVVEDEKKTASFIRKALQSEGFAVDVCHNGSDALTAPGITPYEVIVLDIVLPGRD